jgi:SAM-dependent methyltransferase
MASPPSAFACATTRDWPGYFKAVAGKEPRETLVQALEIIDKPGFAIDLGCGEGRDTVELLARGWRVLAIDGHGMAIDLTRHHPRLPRDAADRLEVVLAEMESVALPACDLLNASFSLPFCRPEAFDGLWERIHAAIRPGGVFAGQLFGDHDDWARLPDRSHQSRKRVGELFRGRYKLEHFEEVESDGQDAGGNAKHWHVFHVVARRCPDAASPGAEGPTSSAGGSCP